MSLTLGNSNIELPTEISSVVFEKAREQSLIARLVTPTTVTMGGTALPVYTSELNAAIVAEAAEKPVDDVTLDIKYLRPRKAAVITILSEEMVRNDPAGVVAKIEEDLGAAIAKQIDILAIHGASAQSGAAVAGQSSLKGEVTNSVEIVNGDYKSGILSAFDLVGAEHDVTAVAFDSKVRGKVLKTVNEVQFGLPDLTGPSAMVAGAPAYFSRSIGTLAGADTGIRGIAGDWSGLAWGMASGIEYKKSDQASIVTPSGTVNLWQTNQIALLVECQVATVVTDPSKFALIKDAVAG